MATRITPSQLDFEQIKESIKQYFKDSGEFNDYNFEGSGLSAIMDALAYNTHLQALMANFSLNEAFLDSAQLRGSVVSHAKSLNYMPGSRNSSQATLNVTINNETADGDLSLPKYTLFSTTVNDISYTFYTLEEYTTNAAANYIFSDVAVHEGTLLTKRFIVDADANNTPVYVISDPNLSVDSIQVQVRSGLGSTDVTSYRRPNNISDFTSEAEIYFIAESASGFYELTFGDGVAGKAPAEGSIIEVKYLSSSADAANGAKIFSTNATTNGNSMGVATATAAFGGAERESVESVRFNAPKAFAAQDRAVTENDFKALITRAVNYIETINVYGGQKATPPEYGKVFIAIKPVGADALTDTQKNQLLENVLNDRVILSITPELIDPEIQYLAVTATVDYDSTKTTLTQQQLQTKIKNTITTFGNDNLLGFSTPFRRSQLTTAIDQSDAAVVSSNVTVKLQRRVVPAIGVAARYDLSFTEPFASVSSFDYILSSDDFQYEVNGVNYTVKLRNKTGTNQIEIYRSSASGDIVVVDDAGTIDTTNNTISLIPFKPSGINDAVEGIRLFVEPLNQNTLSPDRNILLRFDDENITVAASKNA